MLYYLLKILINNRYIMFFDFLFKDWLNLFSLCVFYEKKWKVKFGFFVDFILDIIWGYRRCYLGKERELVIYNFVWYVIMDLEVISKV